MAIEPSKHSSPSASSEDPRRALPAVDRLVGRVRAGAPELPAWAVTAAARLVLAEARASTGAAEGEGLEERAAARARELARPRPGRVVNATGVVLHTNLGRALLAPGAAHAALEAATHYTDLELELGPGRRGDRLAGVAEKLRLLSGAEAGLAVNNNAGALLLAVNTLAAGREVIVSRGELVEIGGSFRLPEILEAAGVRLVEVGTTNRTHPDDYRRAIGPATALLLKVHRSNFEQSGFVAEVDVTELAGIARAAGLPLLEDLGSGTLVDLRGQGFPEASYAPARLRRGADVVCFSGDKLLGGPQAGILLGGAAALGAMGRNPLARALRLDKMSLAALDWTLAALLSDAAAARLPTLRQLTEPAEAVERRARALAERISGPLTGRARIDVEPGRAPVGGGSLPGFELPSWTVALRPLRDSGGGAAARLAARLRAAPVPVVARVAGEAVLLDARTLLDDDADAIVAALAGALAAGAPALNGGGASGTVPTPDSRC
jgi:L-seryl-tRNA(Ser) seleniumtransferase